MSADIVPHEAIGYEFPVEHRPVPQARQPISEPPQRSLERLATEPLAGLATAVAGAEPLAFVET